MSANLTRVTAVTSEDCDSIVWRRPAPNPPNLFRQLNPLVKKEPLLSVACTNPFDIKLMPTKKQPHEVKTTIMAKSVSPNDAAAKTIN